MPVGTLCLQCGTVAESYPLLSEDQVMEKYREEPAFRESFMRAKEVLASTRLAAWPFRSTTVFSGVASGLTVDIERAFVAADDLVAALGMPLKSAGLETCKLIGIEGEMREGRILKVEGLPPGMPYTRVKAWTEMRVAHEDYFIKFDEALREEQAADMLQYGRKQQFADYPSSLRASGSGGLGKVKN